MAYMQAIGPCVVCKAIFSFNARLVPSVVIKGIREPICQSCVDRANPERVLRGLPQIKILPGAYEPEEVA